MKNNFSCFFPLTKAQQKKLWEEGIFVFDTNVFLNLYEYPDSTRNDWYKAFKALKGRTWMPYQVAMEYHFNRKTKIQDVAASVDQCDGDLQSIEQIMASIRRLELDKRGLKIEDALISLEDSKKSVSKILNTAKTKFLQPNTDDPVLSSITSIFKDKIGTKPLQDEIEKICVEGEIRYNKKIPPGYKDAKNKGDSQYFFDGNEYPRKFGDLFLWKQLIEYARESGCKFIAFVTADAKEDWWGTFNGNKSGPHHELCNEIHRDATVDVFQMFTAVRFLEGVSEYLDLEVQQQSMDETAEATKRIEFTRSQEEEYLSRHFDQGANSEADYFAQYLSPSLRNSGERNISRDNIGLRAELAVKKWILNMNPKSSIYKGQPFPDMVQFNESRRTGYEIFVLASESGRLGLNSNKLEMVLGRGYAAINQEKLDDFWIVIVAKDHIAAINSVSFSQNRFADHYPGTGLIAGYIDEKNQFNLVSISNNNYPYFYEGG